jgi:outer membrane autotransporter protein
MTKNRFLSKRLACLLTTALVATPIFLNSSAVKSADLTIANGATTTLTTDTTNNYSIVGASGTLAVTNAAAMTLTGSLTTLTNNVGALTINDTTASGASASAVTITGVVGASDLKLNVINIGVTDATGGHAIFSSDVFATTLNVVGGDALENSQANFKGNVTAAIALTTGAAATVAGAGGTATLTYSGTAAQTQTGAITAAADGTAGILSVTNTGGVVTFGAIGTDALKLTSVTTAENSQTLFQSAVAANTLTINGKAFVAAVDNESETIVLGANSTLYLGRAITNGTTAFNEIAGARPTLTAGSKLVMPVTMTDAQTVTLFLGEADNGFADNATTLAEVNAAIQNNAMFTYASTASATGNGSNIITATARSETDVSSQLNVNLNKGKAFTQAYAAMLANKDNDDGAISAFENALFVNGFVNSFTDQEDTKLANQVSPQTDTIVGSTVAAKAVTSGVQNVISTRLASLRSGDAYSTGVVTGSGMSANSGFIQAFGSKVDQKNKGNEFGYDADTTGFAVGFDGKVDGGAIIGISYAHSNADVDGKGTGQAKNDIKTNLVSLYADYATKDGYVEGSITYGKSDNKGSRIINTADLNRTYTSNYDSEQYSLRISGGIPQSLGGGAFFTPFAGATISQIKADAYTETSTTTDDTLRLRVAQDTVDSQVGTIGVKYHQVIKDGKTTFTPEVKLAVNQEFGDGNITTTNTYQGGGASFKNSTAVERTSATAGVGLNISSDNVSFNIGYEADVKEKYLGHSAQAKITAKF